MRQSLSHFVLLLMFICNSSTAQTIVNGGIFSNTTWTLANSPYLMTNNIVVFPGVTLTIEPGVEVRVKENGMTGTQYYFETRGTINMVGTASLPITFRADTATTVVGTWAGFKIKNSQGGSINYNYVNISNAIYCFDYDAFVPPTLQLDKSTFSYNGYAIMVGTDLVANDCIFSHNDNAVSGWTNFTFNNCVFENNAAAMAIYASSFNMKNSVLRNNNLAIRLNSGALNGITIKNTLFENNGIALDNANDGLVDSCSFKNNVDGLTNTTYLNVKNSLFNNNTTALKVGFGTEVRNNKIEQNQTGIALGPFSFGQPMPVVEDNRICYNQLYNIDNQTDLNLFIYSNCFCSTDSTDIEAKIFDGYDDITKGLINYTIFDTTCKVVLKKSK